MPIGVAQPGRADHQAHQQGGAVLPARAAGAGGAGRPCTSSGTPRASAARRCSAARRRRRGAAGTSAPPPRLTGRLAGAGVGPGGQQDREDGGAGEDHERVAQRPLRAERRGQPGHRRRDRGADDAGERDPAVRLDQRQPGGSSRGTVAARATPYALEATRTPEGGRVHERPTARRRRRPSASTGTHAAPSSRRSPTGDRG